MRINIKAFTKKFIEKKNNVKNLLLCEKFHKKKKNNLKKYN